MNLVIHMVIKCKLHHQNHASCIILSLRCVSITHHANQNYFAHFFHFFPTKCDEMCSHFLCHTWIIVYHSILSDAIFLHKIFSCLSLVEIIKKNLHAKKIKNVCVILNIYHYLIIIHMVLFIQHHNYSRINMLRRIKASFL